MVAICSAMQPSHAKPVDLFRLAYRGKLNTAPAEMLTLEAVTKLGPKTNAALGDSSILVIAAWRGNLDHIPKDFLTQETMFKDAGYSYPFDYAVAYGHVDQVPAEMVTNENLLSLRGKPLSPLHSAAIHGMLHTIPVQFLTAANCKELSTYNQKNNQNSCFHYSAYNKHLDDIPAHLFTLENMLLENPVGCTPLHWVALAGQLDQVPSEWLTTEVLLADHTESGTILASARSCLTQIPLIKNAMLNKPELNDALIKELIASGIELPNELASNWKHLEKHGNWLEL